MQKIRKSFFLLITLSALAAVPACSNVDNKKLFNDLFAQANKYYDNKEYLKAADTYAKAAGIKPIRARTALARYKCARAYKAAGKNDSAIAECSRAIAVDPLFNKGISYRLRGSLYEKTGKYKQAVSDYSKALLINPNNRMIDRARRRVLMRCSVEFAKEGAKVFDEGVSSLNVKKNLQAAKQDFGRALSLFAYARKLSPDNKVATGFVNVSKAVFYEICGLENIALLKQGDTNYTAMAQLRKAYYPFVLADNYFKRSLLYLKSTALINIINSFRNINTESINIVKQYAPQVDYDAAKSMKSAELEATCIANFDAANELIVSGDHDGARELIEDNKNIMSGSAGTYSENAQGIIILADAYLALNKISAYPPADIILLKADFEAINADIAACAKSLGRARSALKNAMLINICDRLRQDIDAMKKSVEQVKT